MDRGGEKGTRLAVFDALKQCAAEAKLFANQSVEIDIAGQYIVSKIRIVDLGMAAL